VIGSVDPERVAFWIPPQVEHGEEPAPVYERFAARLQAHVAHTLPAWRPGVSLLRFGSGWTTSYLSRSIDEGPDAKGSKEAPVSPIRKTLGNVFGKIGVAAVLAFIVIRLYGFLSPAAPPPVYGSPEFMAPIAAEANKSLPTRIDSETELTSVTSAAGRLTYNYRLVNAVASQVNRAAIASLKPGIARSACTGQGSRELLDHHVMLRYSYADKHGAPIAWLDILDLDCFGIK
jgi:hypothetical protein